MGVKSKFGWIRSGWLTVPNVMICEPRLSSVELRVLMYLGMFATPRPTIQQIAQATGVPERSVKRALQELRTAGMVRWFTGYKGKANQYQVMFEHHWDLSHRGPGRDYSRPEDKEESDWRLDYLDENGQET